MCWRVRADETIFSGTCAAQAMGCIRKGRALAQLRLHLARDQASHLQDDLNQLLTENPTESGHT
jgi:hypothetical protein